MKTITHILYMVSAQNAQILCREDAFAVSNLCFGLAAVCLGIGAILWIAYNNKKTER